jgi:hypothetical protein
LDHHPLHDYFLLFLSLLKRKEGSSKRNHLPTTRKKTPPKEKEKKSPASRSSKMAEFVRATIFGTTFEITSRYTELQPVGMGAFGLVCAARDQLTGAPVAVKKIMKPFSTPVLSKRTYRELKLLKHLRHENIICLSDIFISPLEDMYVC